MMPMNGSIDVTASSSKAEKIYVERCTSFGSGTMALNMTIGEFQQRMNNYQHGLLIQDENAFGCLSKEEREFLISGMTPEVWQEVFGVGVVG